MNLLVVLEENTDFLVPYATSFAKRMNCRLTVARPRRDPAGLTDGSAEARHEAALSDQAARNARTRSSLETFATAAAAAGVDCEPLWPDEGQDLRREQVAVFARAFDVTLVGQREPGAAPTHDDLAGALLGDGARPVLVVPAIQRDLASFRRVIVAWDGSAASARAFGDSRPILAFAERVEIVTVTGHSTPVATARGGARLAAQLDRDGTTAEYRRLAGEQNPADAILSYVADVGADLLVAGGYGHSRLREALFGGVTRTLLASQTLPLFLSR
jgi:nucleotide-binding universal stress UspA family protein